MVFRRSPTLMAVAIALAVDRFVSIDAIDVAFQNACDYTIQLYDNREEKSIAPGGEFVRSLNNGFVGMFRHGRGDQATLAEFSIDRATGRPWYDIAIIPAGPGYCTSLSDCKRATNKVGFNVPMQIRPLMNTGRDTCTTVTCMNDGCQEAYQFPKDDSKTHNCPPGTNFQVTFCPGGRGGIQSEPDTQAPPLKPTPVPTPKPTTEAPTIPPTPKQEEQTTYIRPTTAPVNSTESGSGDNSTYNGTVDDIIAIQTVPSYLQKPITVDASKQTDMISNANTKTSHHASSMLGTVMAVLVGIVALMAAAVAVIVRSKKQRLLHMQPKSPLQRPCSEFATTRSPY